MHLQKSHKSAIISTTIWLIVFFLQRFKLYTYESDHLFLWDTNWILEQLNSVGGLNLLATSFLTQFFRFTIVGTTVATTLYCIIIQCGIKLISEFTDDNKVKALAFLPAIFLSLCIEDPFYGFRGHVALTLGLLVVLAYRKMAKRMPNAELATCLIFALVTYLAIGSVSILFLLTILTINVLTKQKALSPVISLAVTLLCGFIANRFGHEASFEESTSPLLYYNWPTGYKTLLLAWLSVPVSLLISFALSKMHKGRDIASSAILIVAVVGFGFAFRQMHDAKTSKLQHECYLADNERWDDIINLNREKHGPTYLISYTNLALAQQGKLLDQMFLFEQQLPVQQTDIKKVSNAILRMTSQIYHHCGYVAGTRKSAFNSNLITPGGIEPHDMLHLLMADKSIGSKDACEKYANLLSKTLFYSNSAKSVLNANAVNLPENNNFCEIHGLGYDLEQIANANPQNEIAKQFNLAYLLLSADKQRILDYLSNKPANEPVHRRIQEACTVMFSADECRSMGVDEEVINDFEKLKKGQKINGFDSSYWFYIAYLNINIKTDPKNSLK